MYRPVTLPPPRPFAASIRAGRVGLTALLGCVLAAAGADEPTPAVATPPTANADVAKLVAGFQGKGMLADGSDPTPAEVAVTRFTTPPGLAVELVAAEPDVVQPLAINFDHRGRMWVVQYKQYPVPAGLKVVRYDQYLRAVFDRVPAPPPGHVPGRDTITVFEDADGDGDYDRHKDVLTDLNIATSVLPDVDGAWVLNPPYLLFYPDADGDDVPDADPVVHLAGFGLEDTHAVANSLTWGPDGWIYGANGSTTTATIRSAAPEAVHFEGQCVWRYHPTSKVFEVFAEGGGNTFSLEIDAAGRVFSGTNAGQTRGMHYPQGSYGVKNWGKHGPLTNPHAFGYFEHMAHDGDDDRFAQAFLIYEADALPPDYRGRIVAANALHNKVWVSDLLPDGSTYRTADRLTAVATEDRWFRPVDLKAGPDGLIYLADWYDSRLTHVDPKDDWHKSSGRIYRLRPADDAFRPAPPEDFSRLPDEVLLTRLSSPNKWVRQTAVRMLGRRRGDETTGRLAALATDPADGRAPEAVWALHQRGELTDTLTVRLLGHADADVRRWVVRLVGDRGGRPAGEVAESLVRLAAIEPDVQVRAQLAASARRLSGPVGLPIVAGLLAHDGDADDPHLPLLIWWALESKAVGDRAAVLELLATPEVWSRPLVERHLLTRLMRRYAAAGGPDDLAACATLLTRAPAQARRLMAGLTEAFAGGEVGALPPELVAAIDAHRAATGGGDLTLDLRRGRPEAIAAALTLAGDGAADPGERVAVLRTLGEIKAAKAVPVLGKLVAQTASPAVQRAALEALAAFDDPAIGATILRAYPSALTDEHGLRSTAQRVLAGRAAWAKLLVAELDAARIEPSAIAGDVVQQLALHGDAEIDAAIRRHFGRTRATPAEMQARIAELRATLAGGPGRADAGRTLFAARCGTCHTLFGEGGSAGPDLTGYERENLGFLLPAVVDPSAAIREEFTTFQVQTTDGRVVVGLLTDQTERTVTLRDVKGQAVTLRRDDVEDLRATPTSLMPDGLLDDFTEAQRRDLFAYLTARTPPGTAPAADGR